MDDCNKKKTGDDNTFQKLLELDKQISEALSLASSNNSKLGYLRPQMKWLEYSCHGLFWIPGCIICLWFCVDPVKACFFFNLLVALILDIVLVAIIKASLRRRRPSYNKDDMFCTVAMDKMSCPSGHTSRAVMISLILMTFTPNLYLLHPFLVVWSIATSLSRVLLGRHFVGDVLVGLLLGYVEYAVVQYIWSGPDTAKWYLDYFTDSGLEDL